MTGVGRRDSGGGSVGAAADADAAPAGGPDVATVGVGRTGRTGRPPTPRTLPDEAVVEPVVVSPKAPMGSPVATTDRDAICAVGRVGRRPARRMMQRGGESGREQVWTDEGDEGVWEKVRRKQRCSGVRRHSKRGYKAATPDG